MELTVPKIGIDPHTLALSAGSKDPAVVRQWIKELGDNLLALKEDHRKFEVKHTFLPGIYMRELFIPADSLLVGRVHKLPCINLVTKGRISILTEHGSAIVEAGHSAVSPAGSQKVGYAIEDTVFVNVFHTYETDLSIIESTFAE